MQSSITCVGGEAGSTGRGTAGQSKGGSCYEPQFKARQAVCDRSGSRSCATLRPVDDLPSRPNTKINGNLLDVSSEQDSIKPDVKRTKRHELRGTTNLSAGRRPLFLLYACPLNVVYLLLQAFLDMHCIQRVSTPDESSARNIDRHPFGR